MDNSNKTLKQKVYDLYKKVCKTDSEPTSFQLASLVNIIVSAAQFCPDAQKEVGKDVLDLFKSCCKVSARGSEVQVTKLMKALEEE